MNELASHGLFGQGLVDIKSPEVIALYNKCLLAIGKNPTALKSFRIDGRGWSPEVAEEQHDKEYLSNGVANPYAIIVTPRQAELPVYVPYHSFDRSLLKHVFTVARRQIADLTSQTALWLDLDQNLNEYTTPDDLTMIDGVVVRVNSIGDLISAARTQRELVHSVREGEGWMNQEARTALSESGEKFGDMRFRSLVIEDIPFMDVSSFYTMAFDGVYVFRNCLAQSDVLMIFLNDQDEYAVDEREDVLLLRNEAAVLERLRAEQVVTCSLDRFKGNKILSRIANAMLAQAIFDDGVSDDFNFATLTSGERAQHYNRIKGNLPPSYNELIRLTKKLNANQDVEVSSLSPELQMLLLRPTVDPEEDPLLYDLVMRILVSISIVPMELLYAFNKQTFFERYCDWSSAQKRWAITSVKENRLSKAQKKLV